MGKGEAIVGSHHLPRVVFSCGGAPDTALPCLIHCRQPRLHAAIAHESHRVTERETERDRERESSPPPSR